MRCTLCMLGSAILFEEMFNPERLSELTLPGPGACRSETYRIAGHEFRLKFTPPERRQLIAFLRTLNGPWMDLVRRVTRGVADRPIKRTRLTSRRR